MPYLPQIILAKKISFPMIAIFVLCQSITNTILGPAERGIHVCLCSNNSKFFLLLIRFSALCYAVQNFHINRNNSFFYTPQLLLNKFLTKTNCYTSRVGKPCFLLLCTASNDPQAGRSSSSSSLLLE